MRRLLILTAAVVTSLSACSSPAQPESDPAASATTSASAEAPALTMDTTTACSAADAAYSTLGPAAQAQIARGVAAEQKGDKATVREALAALQPIFSSTAATFNDTAGKVTDPELKSALNSLGDAAASATLFTTFAEFQSLAAATAPGEAVLKKKCAEAGYTLKNIE